MREAWKAAGDKQLDLPLGLLTVRDGTRLVPTLPALSVYLLQILCSFWGTHVAFGASPPPLVHWTLRPNAGE